MLAIGFMLLEGAGAAAACDWEAELEPSPPLGAIFA